MDGPDAEYSDECECKYKSLFTAIVQTTATIKKLSIFEQIQSAWPEKKSETSILLSPSMEYLMGKQFPRG